MADRFYITRFVVKDGVDENYCYRYETDAIKHMMLFEQDDSDLYEEIQIVEWDGKEEKILDRMIFED